METTTQPPHHPQRPAFPHPNAQSAPSSVFQSSSSLASTSTHRNPYAALPHDASGLTSAPLPSPSAQQHAAAATYFAPQHQPQPQANSIPAAQQGAGGGHMGQRGGASGGLPETAPFLNDFSLVAEAAKRAQVACLTRDLGEVGL